DNFLDVLVIFIKPFSAILIVISIIDIKNSLILYLMSIIISSTVSLPLHLVKSKTRLLTSSSNFFTSNTFISVIEDIFVIIMAILTVFIPLVVFILIGIMLLFIYNRIKKNQFLKTV
ncbi:MAG: DUF4126 domain-containing protein, partial [Armatimonadetes bacterium]|nr:DUF4126 domain-containing protein [Armatimonadota bacterium]